MATAKKKKTPAAKSSKALVAQKQYGRNFEMLVWVFALLAIAFFLLVVKKYG